MTEVTSALVVCTTLHIHKIDLVDKQVKVHEVHRAWVIGTAA